MWQQGRRGDTHRNRDHRRPAWRDRGDRDPGWRWHLDHSDYRRGRTTGRRLVARARETLIARSQVRTAFREISRVRGRNATSARRGAGTTDRSRRVDSGSGGGGRAFACAVDPFGDAAYVLALYWTVTALFAWLRGILGINGRMPDLSGSDASLDHIRESRRMIRESRNHLRKATGNALEPMVFSRRKPRRRRT